MAGEVGNTFSSKNNRLWANTLRRVVTQDPEKLRRIAEAIIAKAADGDVSAIKEIGDRLDGKPHTVISGDNENPLTMIHKIEREIIDSLKD